MTEARNYLWIDMEMTGLDPSTCKILEVSAIVTNERFVSLAEYEAVIFQTPEILAGMDAWCVEHHGKSGLTALVPKGKAESQVEQELLALVDQHFSEKDRPVLCGNSIGQDRKFIDVYMPSLSKRLHYRMVDVSSFKEVFRSSFGIAFEKKGNHRALEDIKESIAELQHYLSFVQLPENKLTH